MFGSEGGPVRCIHPRKQQTPRSTLTGNGGRCTFQDANQESDTQLSRWTRRPQAQERPTATPAASSAHPDTAPGGRAAGGQPCEQGFHSEPLSRPVKADPDGRRADTDRGPDRSWPQRVIPARRRGARSVRPLSPHFGGQGRAQSELTRFARGCGGDGEHGGADPHRRRRHHLATESGSP
jgi:hypothetical protein